MRVIEHHPRRPSIDGQAVAGGVANRTQRLLGVRATHGRDLELPIYAIETSLVDRHTTYDHLDPLSAVRDENAFVKTVIPFLRRAR